MAERHSSSRLSTITRSRPARSIGPAGWVNDQWHNVVRRLLSVSVFSERAPASRTNEFSASHEFKRLIDWIVSQIDRLPPR